MKKENIKCDIWASEDLMQIITNESKGSKNTRYSFKLAYLNDFGVLCFGWIL